MGVDICHGGAFARKKSDSYPNIFPALKPDGTGRITVSTRIGYAKHHFIHERQAQ